MRDTLTYRIVLCAQMAALAAAATLLIRVPSPTGGYINPGDGICLAAGLLLGPWWGAAAAGIGSMLSDIIAGYPAYAAGTLLIKAGMAMAAAWIYTRRVSRGASVRSAAALAGLIGEMVMLLGYFGYTAVFMGYGMGAIAEIPGNLAQAALGVAAAALLTPALLKSRQVKHMLSVFRRRGD